MQVSNLKVLKKIMYEQLITCDLRDLDADNFSALSHSHAAGSFIGFIGKKCLAAEPEP